MTTPAEATDIALDPTSIPHGRIEYVEHQSAAPNWIRAVSIVHATGRRYMRNGTFPVVDDCIDVVERLADIVIAATRADLPHFRGGSVLAQIDDAIVHVNVCGGRSVEVTTWAQSDETAFGVFEVVQEAIERDISPPKDDPAMISVQFWHHSNSVQPPARSVRVMKSMDAVEAAAGLSASAAAPVRELIEMGPMNASGLHIWTGPPGCGKTTMIRSLARSWRDQARIEVILDPEVFVASPAYMMYVLQQPVPAVLARDMKDGKRLDDVELPPRILVLEDAGELIGVQARSTAGQGLSRLLNLSDGMFGDTDRPMVIITSNEPVGELHPAVVRAGRCRSVIEFEPLSRAEATAWAASAGHDADEVSGPITIAELANQLRNTAPVASNGARRKARGQKTLGFSVT